MDIEVITSDANKNCTSETYRNVTHVSVVGNWLYLTMATGEWAKLDSRDCTVEITQHKPEQHEKCLHCGR